MSEGERQTTLDTIFPGALFCRQFRKGYRFNQDSILLAHFPRPQAGERVLDLCTGCGIISLILAYRFTSIKLVGLEIQPDLADLAKQNAVENGLAERFEVVVGDLNDNDVFSGNSFDRVICNPPYLDPLHSRVSTDLQIAVARQGIQAGPDDIAASAARLLVHGGKVNMIYPAERKHLMMSALEENEFQPVRVQSVKDHPRAPEMLVLIEAEKSGYRKTEFLPPFNICVEKGGEHSPEMKKCYEP